MADNGDGTKDLAQVLKRSPVEAADSPQMPGMGWLLYMTMPTGDGFPQWGSDVKRRDKMLREFITKESYFASALATVQARNAAMRWTVTGPPRTSEVYKQMLLEANFGGGWQDFMAAISEDLYSQDSGAFVAPVHLTDSEDSPVIGIHHLDAARCYPTGEPDYPVIYVDRKNVWHRLRPFEIVQLLELAASPEHPAAGPLYRLQRCALTRFLETALRMRNQATYMKEKTGGRFQKAIHLVQGVAAAKIEQAIKDKEERADAEGLIRYIQHTIIGGVDSDTPVDVKTIELAGLPDGFDEDKWLRNYYVALALAFMTDPQEFAPLAGSNLGTSQQSQTLHMKSRGKGPALFQNLISNFINWHVFPATVEFSWQERDVQAEMEQAQADKADAETLQILVGTGILTAEAARQMLVDKGKLPQEIFDLMGAEDVTTERTTDAESKPEREDGAEESQGQEEKERAEGRAGPEEARLDLEATVAEPIALALKRIERNVRRRLQEAEA
jgi:hypothetical protein